MNERIEYLEQQASRLWNQRFVVLGGTTVLVSGIIVWVVNASEHWFSLAAELPVLLILIAACYITKHVTDSAVRILTYLEVFHEFPAAHPIRRFHEGLSGYVESGDSSVPQFHHSKDGDETWISRIGRSLLGKDSPNAGIAWIYLILALTAGCVFLTLCGTPVYYIPKHVIPGSAGAGDVILDNIIAYGHSGAPKELLTVFVFLPLLGYFIIRVMMLFDELPFEEYRESWRELRSKTMEADGQE